MLESKPVAQRRSRSAPRPSSWVPSRGMCPAGTRSRRRAAARTPAPDDPEAPTGSLPAACPARGSVPPGARPDARFRAARRRALPPTACEGPAGRSRREPRRSRARRPARPPHDGCGAWARRRGRAKARGEANGAGRVARPRGGSSPKATPVRREGARRNKGSASRPTLRFRCASVQAPVKAHLRMPHQAAHPRSACAPKRRSHSVPPGLADRMRSPFHPDRRVRTRTRPAPPTRARNRAEPSHPPG